MTKNSTSADKAIPTALADDGGMDWAAFDALTDAEVEAAARSDPDTRPVDRPMSPKARRVGLHGVIRRRLKLSLDEFAARYRIPAETVHGWERGTILPDAAAKAYVLLINADPDGVAAALERAAPAQAAE